MLRRTRSGSSNAKSRIKAVLRGGKTFSIPARARGGSELVHYLLRLRIVSVKRPVPTVATVARTLQHTTGGRVRFRATTVAGLTWLITGYKMCAVADIFRCGAAVTIARIDLHRRDVPSRWIR